MNLRNSLCFDAHPYGEENRENQMRAARLHRADLPARDSNQFTFIYQWINLYERMSQGEIY